MLRERMECMTLEVFRGLMIPFLGTALGAGCVFFMKGNMNRLVQKALTGFAAGVMVAASIWSLLIPAMDQAEGMGKLAFVPAAAGFWLGILFLLLLDHIVPHLHMNCDQAEGPCTQLKKTTMLVLAVTLHNIPEGMAVGVVYAGWMAGEAELSLWARWRCLWALRFRISRRERSFPCRFALRELEKGERFFTALFPGSWSRLEHFSQ